jgi:myosin heavy subunit
MPGKLWTTCPHCRRSNLRIRPENVGKMVACKHCGENFIARDAYEASAGSPLQAPHPEESGPTPAGGSEPEVVALQAELRRLRAKLEARADERDAALREADEARDGLDLMARREHELREQLDQAGGQIRQASAMASELAEAHARIEHSASEIDSLRGRASRADQLEEELRSHRAGLDQLRDELEEARAREGHLGATVGELERASSEAAARLEVAQAALAGEFDRGLARARAESEAVRAKRNDEFSSELGRLERDRDEERSEQRRLLEQAAAERQVFESERQAHRVELERLQGVIQGLRRDNDETDRQIQALAKERDGLLQQAAAQARQIDRLDSLREEAEAAARAAQRERQEEVDGFERALDEARRRNDDSARHASGLEEQLRLARAEAERQDQEHQRILATLRHDLAAARSEADEAERGRAVAAATTEGRGELDHHLAEVQGQLHEARIANERLRALLRIFGMVKHLGG